MPVFPVNHLPEVFPLFQDTLVRFLEGRVEDRPQHNHVAGEVQPNHHRDESPNRLVRNHTMPEEDRVVGEEPGKAHPQKRRQEGSRRRVA